MSDEVRLGRIEDKLDKVVEHIGSIDSTLASQHVSLKEHIKRSDMLEEQMEPIKAHVSMVQGALKFIGLVALVAGIGEGIVEILQYFR